MGGWGDVSSSRAAACLACRAPTGFRVYGVTEAHLRLTLDACPASRPQSQVRPAACACTCHAHQRWACMVAHAVAASGRAQPLPCSSNSDRMRSGMRWKPPPCHPWRAHCWCCWCWDRSARGCRGGGGRIPGGLAYAQPSPLPHPTWYRACALAPVPCGSPGGRQAMPPCDHWCLCSPESRRLLISAARSWRLGPLPPPAWQVPGGKSSYSAKHTCVFLPKHIFAVMLARLHLYESTGRAKLRGYIERNSVRGQTRGNPIIIF